MIRGSGFGNEQGNSQVQSVGGFIPSFAGYRRLFMGSDVQPIAPSYVSRHWNESSVILRNHYGHQLENMLYMIAGRGHSHYDKDSGSVTLWGKGEIIADDFGYYAVQNKVHFHDLHATILHLMGLDHRRLTYRYGGRDYRLTDVFGNVVRDVCLS